MVGICRAARSVNVFRSLRRKSSVLLGARHLARVGPPRLRASSRNKTPGLSSLGMGHLRALLQICARAECGVNIAGHYQSPGGPVALLGGNRVHLLRERVEQVTGDRIASAWPIKL